MSLSLRMATVLAAVALLPAVPDIASAGGSTPGRPNVVLIQTDDQALADLAVMPRTRALIGDAGVAFDRYYASFSLCCPSRATLLTGQYAHNHGVRGNLPPNGSFLALDSLHTLPVWLQRAGYVTAHVGKYLNGYTVASLVPPGWDEWFTGSDPFTYKYYDYVMSENGVPRFYGSRPQDYQTDVLTRKAVGFIERRAPKRAPFFLSLDYLAPHSEASTVPLVTDDGPPPVPAPRHAGTFANEPLPQDPSFDEADVSDKPAHVRSRPRLTPARIAEITTSHRARLESLLAVDEGVEQVVDALQRSGELANTVVLFISDNGHMAGQHRYPQGKLRIYEPSTHLPLLVRGPGVVAGATTRALAGNVDLAPTVLDFAGGTADHPLDGRSLRPVLAQPATDWPRDLLHEYFKEENPVGRESGDPSYTAVRSSDGTVYVEHDGGEVEMYDLDDDPDQLDSVHADPAYAARRAAAAARLAELRTCAGSSCR